MNYSTSLIDEIWFDLQDMGSCFGPIFRRCHQGPIASTRPVFNPVLVYVLSLRTYYFKPHQKLFSFQKKSKKQHDLSLSRNMWKKETHKRIRLSIDLFLGNFFVVFELFQ